MDAPKKRRLSSRKRRSAPAMKVSPSVSACTTYRTDRWEDVTENDRRSSWIKIHWISETFLMIEYSSSEFDTTLLKIHSAILQSFILSLPPPPPPPPSRVTSPYPLTLLRCSESHGQHYTDIRFKLFNKVSPKNKLSNLIFKK